MKLILPFNKSFLYLIVCLFDIFIDTITKHILILKPSHKTFKVLSTLINIRYSHINNCIRAINTTDLRFISCHAGRIIATH